MKKILTALVMTLSTVLATNGIAQEEQPAQPVPTMLPIIMPCGTSQKMIDMLQGDQYQESPIGLGQGTVFMPSGQPVNGQLTLWYNPDGKKNFSVMITLANTDISCIISSGINMELLPVAFGTAI